MAFVGGGPSIPDQVVLLDVTARSIDVLRSSSSVDVDEGYFSAPRQIEFPSEGGVTAFAHFYPPRNSEATAPEGERPPLIVMSHGGPTGEATPGFSLEMQYWTSRGFAVVDVNYGGSTGFGRAYRQRLNGNWGIVDTADCINAARWLAEQGEVDGDRLLITGGSAGGYTTLCALTMHDGFAAGASYYGLADLESFVTGGTHKFESRYLLSLIGPYPEEADRYRARSPINFTDGISCPMLLLQGAEDRVVPPSQAEIMVEALEGKGLPYAYVAVRRGTARVPEGRVEPAGAARPSCPSTPRSWASNGTTCPCCRSRTSEGSTKGGRGEPGPRPGSPRRRGGAASSAMQGSQPEVNAVCRRDERWRKPAEAQPPIIDIDRSGCTKSGWLIRCPDHFAHSPRRIRSSRSSSEAPSRIGARRSVSSIANRQLRNMPSAVSRRRLHVSQNGSVTEAITPTRPGTPSANRNVVAGSFA